jgi:hypothetical protein
MTSAAVLTSPWLSAFLHCLVFRLCVYCWLQYCSCHAAWQRPGTASLGAPDVHVSRPELPLDGFWCMVQIAVLSRLCVLFLVRECFSVFVSLQQCY